MNQEENDKSKIEKSQLTNSETNNNLAGTDNSGCFYSILLWLGLGLLASFIGSLSPNAKSLIGYSVLAIIVFAFLFWNGKDKVIDRAMSAVFVIFLLFVLGALISQCSPTRHEPYDDYLEGVRR